MLYTVIPRERIFREDFDTPTAESELVNIEHGHLQVMRCEDKRVIQRVISGDPRDYLCRHYQPGEIYFD